MMLPASMTEIPNSIWNLLSGLPLIPSSKAAAESWLSRGEFGLVIFGLFIIIGLVGEYWAEHRTKHRERSWIPPRSKKSLDWEFIFVVVVVLSIIGEFVSDADIWVTSDALQTIADGEIETLKLDNKKLDAAISDANARASEANSEIAKANARAAEASQKAAEAQLALEKAKRPRTLSPERQQFITNAVRLYAPQQYRAAVSQAADDGVEFWQSLYAALSRAGWVYVQMPPGQPGVGNPAAGIPIAAAPGVEILFNPTNEARMVTGALALGNALHADGTVVTVNRDNINNPIEAPDVLFIRIGARVPPP